MEELEISGELENMLDKSDKDIISLLSGVLKGAEEFLNNSLCDAEMREKISEKFSNLTYTLESIGAIVKEDIADEAKKSKIHEYLEQADISYILSDIKTEILLVQKEMQERVKKASEKMIKEAGGVTQKIEAAYKSYEDTEREKAEKAEADKEEILEREKNRAKEESLVKYEGNGFWANFKKIREEGKNNPEKKMGFFKALKQAYIQTKEEAEPENSGITTPEIEEIRHRMDEIEASISGARENIEKLGKEQRDLKKRLEKAIENVMTGQKKKLDEATRPIEKEEITEKRIGWLKSKIQDFREGREAKLKAKAEGLSMQQEEARTESARLDKEAEKLSSDRRANEEKLSENEAKINQLEAELEAARLKATDAEDRIADIAKGEKDIGRAKAEVEKDEKYLTEKQNKIRRKTPEGKRVLAAAKENIRRNEGQDR